MQRVQHKVLPLGLGSTILLFGFLLSAAVSANPIPVSNIDLVATGESHACSLSNAGTATSAVHCWGYNTGGQLGDGTNISHFHSRPVQGLPSNIAAITAGNNHTCAVTQTGVAWCWGANSSGQLGNSGNTVQYLPVQVSGLHAFTKIDAGAFHTCAINGSDQLFCWGGNFNGELGDGTNNNSLIPIQITGVPATVNKVSAGNGSTCATTTTQGLFCWGLNISGQLGDGTNTNRNSPGGVSGLLNGNALTVSIDSSHACAVRSNGTVYCWGANTYGQVGDNTTVNSLIPVQVVGISSAQKISVGKNHSCATTQTNEGFCWGDNYLGALGDGTFQQRETATALVGISAINQISTASNFSCATQLNGDLSCWGENNFGQLGEGSTDGEFVPTNVQNAPSNGVALALGKEHSCMRSSNGSVRCWGSNEYGQIGDDSYLQRLTPRLAIPANVGVTAITAGENHNCVLAPPPQAGVSKAFCWGRNASGMLGDGSNVERLLATAVSSSSNAILSIGAGRAHTCLSDDLQNVACTGGGANGQNCQTASSSINQFQSCAVSVPNTLQVKSGADHSCALTSLNQVWCWGRNDFGQLGIGTTTDSSSPVQLTSLNAQVIVAIELGVVHSCAINNMGAVFCWGYNLNGQLGINSNVHSNLPVAVPSLSSGIAELALGNVHSCARSAAGAVQCWGGSPSGQLGNGGFTGSWVPIPVPSLQSNVAHIAAGSAHSCVIRSNGLVQCWGNNNRGELGNGKAQYRAWPASVTLPSPFIFENGFEQ